MSDASAASDPVLFKPSPHLFRGESLDLLPRVVGAASLLAVALPTLWLGGAAFLAMVSIAATVMAGEWTRMTVGTRWTPPALLAAVGVIGAVWLAPDAPRLAGAILVSLAGLAAFAAYPAGASRALWAGAGVLYVGAPCVAFAWLRETPADGLGLIAGLLAVVWATDVAAFAAGRTFKGPKLFVEASPHKTWSGFAGGCLAGTLGGAAAGAVIGGAPAVWVMLGFTLSVMAQGGDILESFIKRRFGVKDASALIPGHGGLLDRLDGHLTATAALTALLLIDPALLRALT